MGQTLSSETLSISGGDGYRYWVGMTMKPSEVGCKKTVYKGVLLGHGPRQWEKVIAKAFTDIPGTKESWKHELNKADVTKQLAAKFLQEYPSLCAIRIVIPGIVQMDRVSNINKWLADKDDGRGLTKDEWISVEELIPGKMGRFCPWSIKHINDHIESKHMQAFSHFTYKYTNGELVACDFQGIYDNNSSKYIFTDSSIHSTFKMYGLFDQGQYGISEFFRLHKCNEFCEDWPRPTPLTPPPSFEVASMLQISLAPASAYENIIFPAYDSENVASGFEENVRDGSERRRHSSERHRHLQRQAEGSWIGHSLDLNDCHRQLNVNSERLAATRDVRSKDRNLPPAYEDLPPTMKKNSQPPHYDSLVNKGGSTNDLTHQNSRSTLQFKGQSGQLRIDKNIGEVYNKFSTCQRSATDPLLLLEDTAEYHESSASGAMCISNPQQLGSQSQSFCKKCTSNPVFYSGETISQSCVPSAPPEECEDINGT